MSNRPVLPLFENLRFLFTVALFVLHSLQLQIKKAHGRARTAWELILRKENKKTKVGSEIVFNQLGRRNMTPAIISAPDLYTDSFIVVN